MIVDTAKKIIESYVNLYIPIKKKEKFNNYKNSNTNIIDFIIILISWFVGGFAIYLSFKCSNGFNIGQLLLALLFAPCYILYHLATSKLCGLI
jgi:hypothetical protein